MLEGENTVDYLISMHIVGETGEKKIKRKKMNDASAAFGHVLYYSTC